MGVLQATTPAPGDCKGWHQGNERFGGRLDIQSGIDRAGTHRTGDAAARFDVCEQAAAACRRELEACRRAAANYILREALFMRGIRGCAVAGRGGADELQLAEIVPLANDRFEFRELCRDASGIVAAIILPIYDEGGSLIDYASWQPDTGDVAIWRGRAGLLGAENIDKPRGDTPLIVHETVADWLRAGREDVCIIDASRAAEMLSGVTIEARSIRHGQVLRDLLARPAPPIVVRPQVERAAR